MPYATLPQIQCYFAFRFTSRLRHLVEIPSNSALRLADPSDPTPPVVVTYLGKRHEFYILQVDYPPYFFIMCRTAGRSAYGRRAEFELLRCWYLDEVREHAIDPMEMKFPSSNYPLFIATAEAGHGEMIYWPFSRVDYRFYPAISIIAEKPNPLRVVRETNRRGLYTGEAWRHR